MSAESKDGVESCRKGLEAIDLNTDCDVHEFLQCVVDRPALKVSVRGIAEAFADEFLALSAMAAATFIKRLYAARTKFESKFAAEFWKRDCGKFSAAHVAYHDETKRVEVPGAPASLSAEWVRNCVVSAFEGAVALLWLEVWGAGNIPLFYVWLEPTRFHVPDPVVCCIGIRLCALLGGLATGGTARTLVAELKSELVAAAKKLEGLSIRLPALDSPAWRFGC